MTTSDGLIMRCVGHGEYPSRRDSLKHHLDEIDRAECRRLCDERVWLTPRRPRSLRISLRLESRRGVIAKGMIRKRTDA